MSMQDYEQAVSIIRRYPHLQDFVGPRSSHIVQAAENELGLKFPPAYRQFTEEYGAGGFGSSEIYGVINDEFTKGSVPNAIWVTLKKRADSALPEDLVTIGSDGMGAYYCIRCKDSSDGETGAIVLFEPGIAPEDQPMTEVASDFGEFLRNMVQQALAFEGVETEE